MGRLFYLLGKSVSGKDTIYRRILENNKWNFKRLVIYTTRPARDGEKNGREYYFVTEEEHSRLSKEGKIIEDRSYDTVYGIWRYFTVADMDFTRDNYLGIGTLESYEKLKEYYGEDRICPLYIEVEDGERLKRAIAREETQKEPKYEEMCRRFLADSEDFSEKNITAAGINTRFQNIEINSCVAEIEKYLAHMVY